MLPQTPKEPMADGQVAQGLPVSLHLLACRNLAGFHELLVAQNLPGYEAYLSFQDPQRFSDLRLSKQPPGPRIPP